MKVFKYPLQLVEEQQIKIPIPYQMLSFQMQNDIPTIWAIVEDISPSRYVTIIIKGTGHDIFGSDLHYIGTAQHGSLVWHAFHKAGYEIIKNKKSL